MTPRELIKLAAVGDLLPMRRQFAVVKGVGPGSPGRVVQPGSSATAQQRVAQMANAAAPNLQSSGGRAYGASMKNQPVAIIDQSRTGANLRDTVRHESVHQMIRQAREGTAPRAPWSFRAIGALQRNQFTRPLGRVFEEATAHTVGSRHLPEDQRGSIAGWFMGPQARHYADIYRKQGDPWAARMAMLPQNVVHYGRQAAPYAAAAAVAAPLAYGAYRWYTKPDEEPGDQPPQQ